MFIMLKTSIPVGQRWFSRCRLLFLRPGRQKDWIFMWITLLAPRFRFLLKELEMDTFERSWVEDLGEWSGRGLFEPFNKRGVEIHNGTEIVVFSTILNFLMFWAMGVCFRVSRVCWNIEYTCVFLSLLDMFSNILTKHLLTFIVCLKWNSSFGLFKFCSCSKE